MPGELPGGVGAGVVQLDSTLEKQRRGLLHRLAAQTGKVQGAGRNGGVILVEILQIFQQAQHAVKGLAEGSAGGFGVRLHQKLSHKLPQLAHRPVQLHVGDGGLGGGAEDEELSLLQRGVGIGIGAGPHGEEAAALQRGLGQAVGDGPAGLQLGQIVAGHGTGAGDGPILNQNGGLGEAVQQCDHRFRHKLPSCRTEVRRGDSGFVFLWIACTKCTETHLENSIAKFAVVNKRKNGESTA